jgi:hypothetical protein
MWAELKDLMSGSCKSEMVQNLKRKRSNSRVGIGDNSRVGVGDNNSRVSVGDNRKRVRTMVGNVVTKEGGEGDITDSGGEEGGVDGIDGMSCVDSRPASVNVGVNPKGQRLDENFNTQRINTISIRKPCNVVPQNKSEQRVRGGINDSDEYNLSFLN